MILFCLVLIFTTLVSGSSSTFQSIKFVPSGVGSSIVTPTSYSRITVHNPYPGVRVRSFVGRPSRSFQFPQPEYPENNELYLTSNPNGATIEIGRNGHITPDFSNGLEYDDPYLITGVTAEALARYIYSRELFFSDIPHETALLKNQKLRRDNGLDGHRLGSIRQQSPFQKYRFSFVYNT